MNYYGAYALNLKDAFWNEWRRCYRDQNTEHKRVRKAVILRLAKLDTYLTRAGDA